MAAESTSRISRPTYCSCRRSAPNLLMRLASSTASSSFSGSSSSASCSSVSPTSSSPSSWQREPLALALGLADWFRSVHRSGAASSLIVSWYHSRRCRSGLGEHRTADNPPSSAAVPASAFSHSIDQLRQIAADVLDHARSLGASAAETEVSEGFGQNVTVRRGEVETIEYNRDKGVGVTVYLGQQRGHASTSDFSPKAVRDTVRGGVLDRPLHRRRRLRRTGRSRPAGTRCARSRPVPPVGSAGGAGDRAGARMRGGGARGGSAHHQLGRRAASPPSSRTSSTPTRWASAAAIRARATA